MFDYNSLSFLSADRRAELLRESVAARLAAEAFRTSRAASRPSRHARTVARPFVHSIRIRLYLLLRPRHASW
jgi:hypothetical protein